MQITSHIMMVRPVHAGTNQDTAGSNPFQESAPLTDPAMALSDIQREFDNMVTTLRHWQINVKVFIADRQPPVPDAVFPNNWITFHRNGKVFVFPMMAASRRAERRQDILDSLAWDYEIKEVVDLTDRENQGEFLEGTGSVVFDHENRKAFACISPRTSKSLFEEFCKQIGYEAHAFTALDHTGSPLFHTNMMLAIGEQFALACLDAIPDPGERAALESALTISGKELISISVDQMARNCGNIIQLYNWSDQRFIILSETAWNAFDQNQKQALHRHGMPLWFPLKHIERNGGSARCMIAEIFLPKRLLEKPEKQDDSP